MRLAPRLTIAAFGLTLFSAGVASAQELVVNGGFEDGLTGWVVSNSGGCVSNVVTGVTIEAQTLAPTEGANLGGVGNPPDFAGGCVLYQNVNLPSGGSIILNFDFGAIFRSDSDSSETVTVTIQSFSPPMSLTLFSQAGPGGNVPMGPAPPVDLSAFAGKQVRFRIASSHENRQVFGAIDRVSIVHTPPPVPTLAEWAMILLSLMLAGAGAWMIQRRGGRSRRA